MMSDADSKKDEKLEEKSTVKEVAKSSIIDKCNLCETLKSLISDAFLIALAIIIPFIIITVWLVGTHDTNSFKEISSVWGVWVGSVLGYYFGSRPVDALSRRVQDVLGELDINRDEYEAELNEQDSLIDNLQDKYDSAVRDIQYIVIKYPSPLTTDTALIERLKKEYGVIV